MKMNLSIFTVACVVLLSTSLCVHALDNGLSLTPPMGWLVWERFRCNVDCQNDPTNCISENLFMEMADHLAADGYLAAGYNQVNIDDCWSSQQRDSQGRLQADPTRFPSGIQSLANYVHGKGLKLGIYGDFGTFTCSGYPGSEYYLQVDADTFASWGVDMVKLDGCNSNISDMSWGYPDMSKYLIQTGRPMVYSCSWPAYIFVAGGLANFTLMGEYCNLWRLYWDVQDSWDSVTQIIDYWAANQDVLVPAAGPGKWNDPDMLIIGDFSLNVSQSRAQMAIWCVVAAPLLMSNDLRNISDWAKEILLNGEVIAVDQDPLGIQGQRISSDGTGEVWARPLVNNQVAVVLFNRGPVPYPITFSFSSVGICSQVTARDLFAHQDLGNFQNSITLTVPPVDVIMLRLTPTCSESV